MFRLQKFREKNMVVEMLLEKMAFEIIYFEQTAFEQIPF